MTLASINMCQQLGRFLGRATGDAFVEPTSSTNGTIYATALPALKNRLSPAVAIVPQPSATNEPMVVSQRISMVMHANAASNQAAMEMIGRYAALLFPNNRPGVLVEVPFSPGIIGVPSVLGTHAVWRITSIRQLDHPQLKPRTEEGLAAASFGLEVHALQTTVEVA